MGPLSARIARNLRAPWLIPEKVLFRLRLTRRYERSASKRWERAAERELAAFVARLTAITSEDASTDRFAPIFDGWSPGAPTIEEEIALDADWYRGGVGCRGPIPGDVPEAIARLIREPELGSSKAKLLPIFFDLGRIARSVFEAGVYTGVSSTAFLAASGSSAYLGSDIILRQTARMRLGSFLGASRVLFEAPVRAISLPPRSIDVLFLDMVHDVRNLAPTVEHVLPWLARGGVLIIDDVGYAGSLYTPDSFARHMSALERGDAAIPPLVLERDAYRKTREAGHLAELSRVLARSDRKFSEHHVADGGGTVFLWERG